MARYTTTYRDDDERLISVIDAERQGHRLVHDDQIWAEAEIKDEDGGVPSFTRRFVEGILTFEDLPAPSAAREPSMQEQLTDIKRRLDAAGL